MNNIAHSNEILCRQRLNSSYYAQNLWYDMINEVFIFFQINYHVKSILSNSIKIYSIQP